MFQPAHSRDLPEKTGISPAPSEGGPVAAGDALLEALRMFFDLNEWCGLWECARVTDYDAERMTVRVEREYVAEDG